MILPAMPAFYQQPKTLDDLADFMAGKILSALGFEHEPADGVAAGLADLVAGAVGTGQVQQLADHGEHTVEVAGPRGALEHLAHRAQRSGVALVRDGPHRNAHPHEPVGRQGDR